MSKDWFEMTTDEKRNARYDYFMSGEGNNFKDDKAKVRDDKEADVFEVKKKEYGYKLEDAAGKDVLKLKLEEGDYKLKDPEGNPLHGEELKDRIDELLQVRERYYSQAHIIIPADTMKVGPTVDVIVKRLRGLIT